MADYENYEGENEVREYVENNNVEPENDDGINPIFVFLGGTVLGGVLTAGGIWLKKRHDEKEEFKRWKENERLKAAQKTDEAAEKVDEAMKSTK